MAHLVRNRHLVVQRLVVVEKYIRMYAVRARRIRAAGLAAVLVYVDPALVNRRAQLRRVFFAHYLKRLNNLSIRLLIGQAHLDVAHYRHVHVVRAHSLKPH